MDHSSTGLEHLQDMYKNVGRTLATQRKSREEATVALRKKKREEFFTAKRGEFSGTLPVESLDNYESYPMHDPEVTEALFSNDPEKINFSLMVYIARLEKNPEKGQTEFWDMMDYNVLSTLIEILRSCEQGSHQQFLVLRILAQVSEDSDIAVAISEGTNFTDYILSKFTSFDEKCMGEVLITLSNIVSSSSIPYSSDQALFVIDRCRRICYESPMTHIRTLAALVMTKVIDNLEEGIHLPTDLVDFAGDLIVSSEVRLRISGYCLFNSFFCDYRMGNAVVSSEKWLPALERCTMVGVDESYEIFYLLENLCNFMLPYELERAHLLSRMWDIVENPKFQSSDKRLKALGVLTELSVSSPEKMQLLLDSNPRAQESLADLLVNANFDTRRQVLLLLRNLFLNLPHSIPILAGRKTIEGISDLLTVMQPDTVVFALECLKAILDHGGSPADDNGNERAIRDGDYSMLAEEANVHSRLDFLVSSPNEQVALLAMEILHTYVDTRNDDEELPDDLKDIEELHRLMGALSCSFLFDRIGTDSAGGNLKKLGLAESYLVGDWNASPGPKDLLTLLIRARAESSSESMKTKKNEFSGLSFILGLLVEGIRKCFFLLNYLQHKWRQNTLSQSRKNIKDHYDLGNDMFRLFLDDSMTYSCGVFEGDLKEKVTKPDRNRLYEAQMKKYDMLFEKLDLKPEDHVLEIGCGWGACGIRAVEKYGCKWTGLTISEEQFIFATEKVKKNGLEKKIEIKFLDYRNENGIYDKIISIEMIEAVGHSFLPVYFKKISKNLKSQGRAVIQAILCPDEYYEKYCNSSDFIKKHIFPGGHMPCLKAIFEALPEDLKMEEKIQKIGLHYSKTLDFWTSAWIHHRSRIHSLGYSDYFFRKWEFYFVLCSSLFEYGNIDNAQLSFVKI